MSALQGLVNFCQAGAARAWLRSRVPVLVAASLPVIAGVAPASAGPAPVPFYDWSGFYVGLNGGPGGGPVSPMYDLNALPQPGFPGTQYVDLQHHRMGGAFAGGQAGYNRQFDNNVVVGIESDLQWSNVAAIRGDTVRSDYGISGGFPNGGTDVWQMRVQQNWFGTTRLRAGYAFADRFLAYTTFGLAYSNFSISNSGAGNELYPTPGVTISDIRGGNSSTRIGWAAGAGFELAITSRVSLKSEYLYTSYSGITAPYSDYEASDPHNTLGTFSSRDLGIHLVRAGLNYRFSDGAPNPGTARAAMPAWTPVWTGFYAGINGGYGAGVIKPNESELLTNTIFSFPGSQTELSTVNTNSSLRGGGFATGAQAGYNRELPNGFLAGIETDLQWSGIRGSSASDVAGVWLYNPVLPFSSGNALSVNQNWFGTTRLRVGYRPTERLLAYATGGLAYSGFSAGLSRSFYDPIDGPAVGIVSGWGNATRLGWAAGAGFEYALWRNVSFKTEYLYAQYGGFNVAYRGYDTDNAYYYETTQGTLSTGTIGIHLVRGGLNWKFGE